MENKTKCTTAELEKTVHYGFTEIGEQKQRLYIEFQLINAWYHVKLHTLHLEKMYLRNTIVQRRHQR